MNDSKQNVASESAVSESGVALSKGAAQGTRETPRDGNTSGSTAATSTAANPTTSANVATGADKTARNWAVAAHLSGLSLYLGIPFGNILGPLVVWLIKKDESPYAEQQAKEALNFQISLTIYGIVAALLAVVFIGFLLIPVLFVLQIVLTIVATIRVSEGKPYEYPLTIRLVS